MIDPTKPPPLVVWRLLWVPLSFTNYRRLWYVFRIFGIRVAVW